MEEPFAKWFVGGQLNVSYNCLDRLGTPRANKAALIWEGEPAGARQAGRRAHAHLQTASSRGLPLRQCAQAQRHQARRPRPHLPADGARGRHRHARLRPHRRGALGRLRRLQRAIRRRPHPGFARPSWSSPPTAASGAAPWCRSSRMWTKRSRSRTPRANCWPRRSRRSSCSAAPTTRCSSRRAATCGGIEELEQRRRALPGGEDGQRSAALHSLHQRLDRQTQGHPAHHRRLPALRQADHQIRLRSARGGRLLVHRRRRLGHRPQLRGLWPAGERRDEPHVRRRAQLPRAGPLLAHRREVRRDDSLHRAHGDPRVHEMGRRVAEEARPELAAPARHGRRADQSRGVDVVSTRSSAASAAPSWIRGGRPRPAAS